MGVEDGNQDVQANPLTSRTRQYHITFWKRSSNNESCVIQDSNDIGKQTYILMRTRQIGINQKQCG